MYRGGFRTQIIDHVLIVLPDAFTVIKRFAVKSETHPVGSIAYVEVLRAHPADNSAFTYLHAVWLGRNQRVFIWGYDRDPAQEHCQCLAYLPIEQSPEIA